MINADINADTKVFAVLGCPVGHSLSPLIQNTAAGLKGHNMVYTAMCVEPEQLGDAVKGGRALGISGFNITVPHKKAVMEHLCGLDPLAELIGAVNTLKLTENGYVGYNTDAVGAYYALAEAGADVKDKNVLVIGAGGAGYACAAMAFMRGAKSLYIANRTVAVAKAFAEHLALSVYKTDKNSVSAIGIDDIYGLDGIDIVINTTILGFGAKAGQTPVKDVSWCKKAGVSTVFDVVYSPWETRLLREAKGVGIKTVNGFPMLVYQALAAQEIWFDTEFTPAEKQEICAGLTKYYLSN